MDTNNHILQVHGLNIYYGNFHAVRDVSFDVLRASIWAIGTKRCWQNEHIERIEGLLKPQSGSIIVAGNDIHKKPLQAKAAIGVQLQATSFQSELTVSEILQLYSGIYGVAMDREKLFYSF